MQNLSVQCKCLSIVSVFRLPSLSSSFSWQTIYFSISIIKCIKDGFCLYYRTPISYYTYLGVLLYVSIYWGSTSVYFIYMPSCIIHYVYVCVCTCVQYVHALYVYNIYLIKCCTLSSRHILALPLSKIVILNANMKFERCNLYNQVNMVLYICMCAVK